MRDQRPGLIEPISPTTLFILVIVGLVLGWLAHPAYESLGVRPPLITWPQPVALGLVATIQGYTAWLTWRQVHLNRARLPAHQAVNRLMLARACAFTGAFIGGSYAGYAISWTGDPAALAGERAWRSLIAAATCAAVVGTSLWLERSCRVPEDGDPTAQR